MKVGELLREGFFDYSVDGSDSAWDLHHTVEQALEKAEKKIRQNQMVPDTAVQLLLCREAITQLKKGLKNKGNEYNTHGTLNVAMIIDERFSKFRRFKEWKQFAAEVAAKLKAEVAERNQQSAIRAQGPSEYTQQMAYFANNLERLSK